MTSRPRARLAACVLAPVAALVLPPLAHAATPSSTRSAATHRTFRPTSGHHRARRRTRPAGPLTRAQIEQLIKRSRRPGPPGAAGPAGPAGTNGAVAGYSAAQTGPPLNLGSSPSTVVSKMLPPGNFIVHAKVVLNANTSSSGSALAECNLMSGSSSLDKAQWDQPLSMLIANAVYAAAATLPVQAGVVLTAPSSVSLQCFMTGPSVQLTASNAQLQAVQVNTAN
jgi:hypothetical protein